MLRRVALGREVDRQLYLDFHVHFDLHVDVRALVVDPANPDVVFAGTDGGLFKTTTGGR